MNNLDNLINACEFKITEASFAKVGSFWSKIVDFYPHNRLYYITDGEATMILKDKKIYLQKEKLYFIPAYQVVTGNCENFLSHYYIHFEPEYIANNIFDYFSYENGIDADSHCEYLFKTVIENYNINDLYSKLLTEGAFYMIISKYLKHSEILNQNIIRFSPILKYIDLNIKNNFSIKELANVLNLDEGYFLNLFTKTFGISPLKFVITKKLNLSLTMIAKQDKNIGEISDTLGFSDPNYFSRIFKKHFDITPSEYKSSFRKKL